MHGFEVAFSTFIQQWRTKFHLRYIVTVSICGYFIFWNAQSSPSSSVPEPDHFWFSHARSIPWWHGWHLYGFPMHTVSNDLRYLLIYRYWHVSLHFRSYMIPFRVFIVCRIYTQWVYSLFILLCCSYVWRWVSETFRKRWKLPAKTFGKLNETQALWFPAQIKPWLPPMSKARVVFIC